MRRKKSLGPWEDFLEDEEEGMQTKIGDDKGICPTIPIPNEERVELSKPFRKALIVKLLGRTLRYKTLEVRLQRIWRFQGIFKMIGLGNGYFMI